jgi:hypothetical protein
VVQRADASGVRRLDGVRFVVRVGPALGLMGTLIPMGISLAGLAQGNLPKMAESMTTAFTATVVGLACSVSAYVLTLVREHWLRSDLTEIAFAAEALLASHGAKPHWSARRPDMRYLNKHRYSRLGEHGEDPYRAWPTCSTPASCSSWR